MAKQSASEQTLGQKLAEVKLRRDTAVEQLADAPSSSDELRLPDLLKILQERVTNTLRDVQALGLPRESLEPFLEIGAERGQRAAALVNRLGLRGVATDLSVHSLLAAERLAEPLGLEIVPERLCADAYNLPFASDTFPFVFTYQTLHHFPDPAPILAEVHRVLRPGGRLWFGDEPMRHPRLVLYRYGHRLTPAQKLLRRAGLLGLIGRGGRREEAYGVVEGEFSLAQWRAFVAGSFADFTLWTRSRGLGRRRHRSADRYRGAATRALIGLVGGRLECLAVKAGPPPEGPLPDPWSRLICPDCRQTRGAEVLLEAGADFRCPQCGRTFDRFRGLLLALPASLQEEVCGCLDET